MGSFGFDIFLLHLIFETTPIDYAQRKGDM